MPRCALVNPQTGLVDNVIMADPQFDAAPAGMVLIEDTDGHCDIGWRWSKRDGLIVPQDLVDRRIAHAEREAQMPFLLYQSEPAFIAAVDRIRKGDTSADAFKALEASWGDIGFRFYDQALLLQSAAAARGPILEHGSGLSTIALGLGAEISGQTVTSIEPSAEWQANAERGIELAGLKNVTIVASMRKLPDSAGLVFVDGTLDLDQRAAFIRGLASVNADEIIIDDVADDRIASATSDLSTARAKPATTRDGKVGVI